MADGRETMTRRLPKPRVAGSNPVARSTNPQVYQGDSRTPPVSRSRGKPSYHSLTTASGVASAPQTTRRTVSRSPVDEGAQSHLEGMSGKVDFWPEGKRRS